MVEIEHQLPEIEIASSMVDDLVFATSVTDRVRISRPKSIPDGEVFVLETCPADLQPDEYTFFAPVESSSSKQVSTPRPTLAPGTPTPTPATVPAGPDATSTPTPATDPGAGDRFTPAATATLVSTRLPSVLEDTAALVARPHVTSVMIGTVTAKERRETLPLETGGSAEYSYWTVNVERYLADPQPYPTVRLRFIESFIQEDGRRMPPRFPVTLKTGQRAVFFLTRTVGTAHVPVQGDTFTVPLGPAGYGGIRTITQGKVHACHERECGPEPLEAFISRIDAMAREHGREVSHE